MPVINRFITLGVGNATDKIAGTLNTTFSLFIPFQNQAAKMATRETFI